MGIKSTGKDTVIQIYRSGQLIQGIKAAESTFRPDGEFVKSYTLGEKRPDVQYDLDGYQGSIVVEIENAAPFDLMDYIERIHLAGVGGDEIAIQGTFTFPDRSKRRLRFVEVKLGSPDCSVPGKDKCKATIEWRAKRVIKVR